MTVSQSELGGITIAFQTAPPLPTRRALVSVALGLIAAVLPGCHHGGCQSNSTSVAVTNALVKVWTGPGWPPENHSIPAGFKISPFAAYQAVAQSRQLSLKHDWICYRDDRGYYIADSFGQPPSVTLARRAGVFVDGQTGIVTIPGAESFGASRHDP